MRIVVSTNPDRGMWLEDFIDSVPAEHLSKVEVYSTYGFELDALRQAYVSGRHSQRIMFFQDSVLLKDVEGIIRKAEPHPTCLLLPRPSCYLAVYNAEVLAQMWWPNITKDNKEESIRNETIWMDSYEGVARNHFGLSQVPVLFPELTDARALKDGNIGLVHGERRLHLENEYLDKRKGTWR